MKKIISVCTIISMTLSGCSLKNSKSLDEMPSDKPYNRIVMETENGYYYNVDDCILSLRYTEKSNGADIFLCAKPECTHSGENTCTATYEFLNISNFIMYDGSIYFVAYNPTPDTLGCSLFKASLDGTSLDNIGDIRRVKYPSEEKVQGYGSLPGFVIHKGYAFIPYLLGESGYGEFVESGFVKMDINTGKTETIFSTDNFENKLEAKVDAGCGNYVYYSTWCSNGDKSRAGEFRYNMENGKSEKISDVLGLKNDGENFVSLSGITEKTVYTLYGNYDDNEYHLLGHNAETLEPDGVDFAIPFVEYGNTSKLRFYNDKIFICRNETIDVYSDKGELIGQHKCQPYILNDAEPVPLHSLDQRTFDISDNKLYIGYADNLQECLDKGENTDRFLNDTYYSYYYCPVENIIAGTGDWAKAYTVKNDEDYWKERPVPEFIKRYIIPKYQQ